MKAKSINLSADLTEALKAQAPYSKRGRSLAQNAISMLDATVSNVSYELQSEIDRLYYKNFRNDETTARALLCHAFRIDSLSVFVFPVKSSRSE